MDVKGAKNDLKALQISSFSGAKGICFCDHST